MGRPNAGWVPALVTNYLVEGLNPTENNVSEAMSRYCSTGAVCYSAMDLAVPLVVLSRFPKPAASREVDAVLEFLNLCRSGV